MKRNVLLMIFSLLAFTVKAQDLSFNFLLNPSVRIGAEYLPVQEIVDNERSMQRYFANFVIPVQSKFSIKSLKINPPKFVLNVSQKFLTLNAGMRLIQADKIADPSPVYNLTVGITGLEAGLGKGIWFYTANTGIVQDIRENDRLHPFFTGAFGFIRFRGLRKQDIYGVAVGYQYGRVFPIPLLGLNRKVSKKTQLSLLLPLQAQLKYKVSRKSTLSWMNALTSLQAGVRPAPAHPEGFTEQSQISLALFQARTSLFWEYKLKRKNSLFLQAGYIPFERISFFHKSSLIEEGQGLGSFFVQCGMNLGLGKRLINSKIFGNDF